MKPTHILFMLSAWLCLALPVAAKTPPPPYQQVDQVSSVLEKKAMVVMSGKAYRLPPAHRMHSSGDIELRPGMYVGYQLAKPASANQPGQIRELWVLGE